MQLMLTLSNVSPLLNAPTAKNQPMETVKIFAIQDSSIMREFASTEDASPVMQIMDLEDALEAALDQELFNQSLALPVNSF
jgi:hypothetical protein